MYHYNLIEDEQEAKREKLWTRTAIFFVFLGLFFFWYNYKEKNS